MTQAECRMKDCPNKVSDPIDRGFCADHAQRLRTDKQFMPINPHGGPDGENICGLCDAPVYLLQRCDGTDQKVWVLDRRSTPTGRCHIVDGGFRVVTPEQRDRLIEDGIPLFQTHRSICTKRPSMEDGDA